MKLRQDNPLQDIQKVAHHSTVNRKEFRRRLP